MGISRRDLLLCVASWGLLPLGLSRIKATPHPADPVGVSDEMLRTQLSGLFSNLDHARAVGRRYLESFPAEAIPPSRLGVRLRKILPADPGSLGQSIKEVLHTQRRLDFARGETVMLDGWILARTEVQLCAFLALA